MMQHIYCLQHVPKKLIPFNCVSFLLPSLHVVSISKEIFSKQWHHRQLFSLTNCQGTLTCTWVVINPDVTCFADAHKWSWCVHTHGILPTVMPSFSTLINICGQSSEANWTNTAELPWFPVVYTNGKWSALKSISPALLDQVSAGQITLLCN